MKIEVGEYYLSANCEIIKIETMCDNIIFLDRAFTIYSSNGKLSKNKDTCLDLIAHIPKQLLNHLVVEVNNYHSDNEFKQMIDNVYGETK